MNCIFFFHCFWLSWIFNHIVLFHSICSNPIQDERWVWPSFKGSNDLIYHFNLNQFHRILRQCTHFMDANELSNHSIANEMLDFNNIITFDTDLPWSSLYDSVRFLPTARPSKTKLYFQLLSHSTNVWQFNERPKPISLHARNSFRKSDIEIDTSYKRRRNTNIRKDWMKMGDFEWRWDENWKRKRNCEKGGFQHQFCQPYCKMCLVLIITRQ